MAMVYTIHVYKRSQTTEYSHRPMKREVWQKPHAGYWKQSCKCQISKSLPCQDSTHVEGQASWCNFKDMHLSKILILPPGTALQNPSIFWSEMPQMRSLSAKRPVNYQEVSMPTVTTCQIYLNCWLQNAYFLSFVSFAVLLSDLTQFT